MARKHRRADRQPDPRPRAALHPQRRCRGELRARGQSSLAQPADQRVGGADLLLRHRVLARAGRERRRVARPGKSRDGRRTSRPAHAGRPRRARSAPRSRSSPTRSDPASAGPPRQVTRKNDATAVAAAGYDAAPPPGRAACRRLQRATRSRSDGRSPRANRTPKKAKDTGRKVQEEGLDPRQRADRVRRLEGRRTCCAGSCPTGPRSVPGGSTATTSSSSATIAKAIKNAREMALLPVRQPGDHPARWPTRRPSRPSAIVRDRDDDRRRARRSPGAQRRTGTRRPRPTPPRSAPARRGRCGREPQHVETTTTGEVDQ